MSARCWFLFIEDAMTNPERQPFEQVLEALGQADEVSLALLYYLTDLSQEEKAQFSAYWPTVKVERRRVIVRHLADISEENFQVDFTDVFAQALGDPSPAVRAAGLDGLWDCDRVSLIGPVIELARSDPDQGVRQLAAATLGQFVLLDAWGQLPEAKVEPAISALIALLDDARTPLEVYRAALESLGPAGHPRVEGFIQRAYESDDPRLGVSALYAMGRSADPAWLPIILGEFESPSMEFRREAARAAGAIGDNEAIEPLVELIMQKDEDEEVRLAAVGALGMIETEEGLEALQLLYDEPDLEAFQDAIEEAIDGGDFVKDGIAMSMSGWDDEDDWDDELDDDVLPEA
ncbi:MAG: HEAT repeat domain-containing protein [Candidatus Promineifilaceae bacterium]